MSKPRQPPARRPAGFTLLEVMIGLSLFVIAGLGVMEIIGLINQNATVNRALTAGRMLVAAKIAKAQTDVYTPSNGGVPLSCTAPISLPNDGPYPTSAKPNAFTGNAPYVNKDSAAVDPFDFRADPNDPTNGTQLMVIGNADNGTFITGTMTQTVSTYEATSKTLLVTFTLTFSYRGKSYTVTQSTIRAPDQL